MSGSQIAEPGRREATLTLDKMVERGHVKHLKPLKWAYPSVQSEEDFRIIGVVVMAQTKFF